MIFIFITVRLLVDCNLGYVCKGKYKRIVNYDYLRIITKLQIYTYYGSYFYFPPFFPALAMFSTRFRPCNSKDNRRNRLVFSQSFPLHSAQEDSFDDFVTQKRAIAIHISPEFFQLAALISSGHLILSFNDYSNVAVHNPCLIISF